MWSHTWVSLFLGCDITQVNTVVMSRDVVCRTFLPAQLSSGGVFSIGNYETQPETMKRALAWLQATGA